MTGRRLLCVMDVQTANSIRNNDRSQSGSVSLLNGRNHSVQMTVRRA